MMTTVLPVMGLLAALGIGDVIFETLFPKIERVEIRTSRLARGQELTILQVSDLHFLPLRDSFLERVKATRPDVVAITGDLVNGREQSFARVYRVIGKLREACPHVFFVSGNNDWGHRRYRELAEGKRIPTAGRFAFR
jgi:predicted MPP superfamily phosphohydrolase